MVIFGVVNDYCNTIPQKTNVEAEHDGCQKDVFFFQGASIFKFHISLKNMHFSMNGIVSHRIHVWYIYLHLRYI